MRWSCVAVVLAIGCGSGSGASTSTGGSGGAVNAGGSGGGPGLQPDAGAAGASGTGGAPGTGGVGGMTVGPGDAASVVADGPAQSPDAGLVDDASTLAPDGMLMMGPTPDGSVVIPADGPAPAMDAAPVLTPDAATLEPDAPPPTPDMAPATPDVSPDVAADMATLIPDAAPTPADTAPPACIPATELGCPAGQWCSALTHTCLTATGSLHWTFTDSCALAGAQVDVKLFDQTHGGAWPAAGIIYVIPYSQTKNIDIACIPGATVCFGAEDHATGNLFWGVGLSNNHACTSCCTTCSPPGNVPPQNLICN